MSERIRGTYDDALYKSTFTLLIARLHAWCTERTVAGGVDAIQHARRCRFHNSEVTDVA